MRGNILSCAQTALQLKNHNFAESEKKMEERLQKIISSSGLMSRRAAEKYIEEGRVTVNGTAASLGAKADISRDEILVDGKALSISDKKI